MKLPSEVFINATGVHPRLHAKDVDRLLGFKITKIEEKLVQKYRVYNENDDSSSRKRHFAGTQVWIGLHPQILQTPYCEIYKALSLLKNQNISKIVDIGAGYGRVGLVMSYIFPHATFVGYEIMKKRQVEGNRIFEKYGLSNCELLQQNVLEDEFDLPMADIYFIYDFSEKQDVSKILNILAKRARTHSFYLIVSGDGVQSLLSKTYSNVWYKGGVVHGGKLNIYQTGGKGDSHEHT